MKQIARVDLSYDLSVFSRWLSSQALVHRIVEEGGMQVVLMSDDQHSDQVAQVLNRYLNESEFRQVLDDQSTSPDSSNSLDGQRGNSALVPPYPRATPRQAPVIFLLISLSCIAAYLSDFGQGGALLRSLLILDPFKLTIDLSGSSGRWDGLVEMLAMGEVWRVITPDFLHFSVMHITFNLLMLWVLGGQLEIQKGSLSFVALTVFVSIISNIAQLLETGYLFGGMSGVVYGLVGYCWLWKYFQPQIFFPSVLMKFSVAWLILGYTPLTEWLGWGRMANAAHLYGLLAGVVWGGVTLFVNEKLLVRD